jgi:hypothetical protein
MRSKDSSKRKDANDEGGRKCTERDKNNAIFKSSKHLEIIRIF